MESLGVNVLMISGTISDYEIGFNRGAAGSESTWVVFDAQTKTVGINDATPGSPLVVVGENDEGKWRVQSYGGMYFGNNSDAGYERYIHGRSDGGLSIGRVSGSNLTGGIDGYAATNYDHVYIAPGGSVGIGTTSPADLLHIDEGDIRINDGNNGTIRGLYIRHSGITGNVTSLVQDTSSTPRTLLRSSERSLWIQAASDGGAPASDLRLYANQTLGLMVSSSGNVGIGTTLPTSTLTVIGNQLFDGTGINLKRTGILSGRTWNFGVDSNGLSIYDIDSSSYRLTIDEAGKVGVGTSGPENKLHILTADTDATQQVLIQNSSTGDAAIKFNISGDTYSVGIDNSDSDKFKISYGNLGNNDRITIDSNGNVGIGDSSPSYKLEVAGTGYFSGLLYTNDIEVDGGNTILVNNSSAGHITIGGLRNEAETGYLRGNITFTRDADQLTYDNTNNVFTHAGGGSTDWSLLAHHSDGLRIYSGPSSNGFTASYADFKSDYMAMYINSNGAIQLGQYGSGNRTGTAVYNLQVDSSGNIIESPAAVVNQIDGAGAVQYIARWEDSDTLTTSSMYETAAGSIGIGTTSPTSKLQVIGQAKADNFYATANTYGVFTKSIYFDNTENDGNYYTDQNGMLVFDENFHGDSNYGTGTYDPVNAFTTNGGGLLIKNEDGWGALVSSQNMRWLNADFATLNVQGNATVEGDLTVSGKVTAQEFHTEFVSASIIYQSGSTQFGNSNDDTHTFQGTLSISKNGTDSVVITNTTNEGNYDDLIIKSNFDRDVGLKFETTGGSNYIWQDSNGDDSLLFSDGDVNTTLELYQDQRAEFYGNVGIGRTPSYKLDIEHNSTWLARFRRTSGTPHLRFENSSENGDFAVLYASNTLFKLARRSGSNDEQDIWLAGNSDGNVGIGTDSPAGRFNSYISATRQITHNGNGGDFSVISDNNSAPVAYIKGTGTADLLNVFDNTSEVFTITDGGNVGINQSGPTSKLHIVNNVTNPDLDLPSSFAVEIDGNHSGATALTADREQGGIYIDLDSSTTGGDTSNEHRLYGAYVDVKATGDPDLMMGGFFRAEINSNAGTISNVFGMDALAIADSSTHLGSRIINLQGGRMYASVEDGGRVDNAYGGRAFAVVSSNRDQAVNNAVYGFHSEVQIDSNVEIPEVFGVYSYIDSNSPHTSSFHSLFYGNYTGTIYADNTYGVYIVDDIKNYFAGSVGIGTGNPDRKLHVNSGTTNHVAIFESTDSTGYIQIKDNSGYSNIASAFGHLVFEADQGQDQADSYMQFKIDTAEKMRITAAGNLGLGISTPTAGLHVSRSMNAAFIASFENQSNSGHGLIIQAGGTSGTRYITQWKDAAGTERFHMDDTGEAYFQNDVTTDGIFSTNEYLYIDRTNDERAIVFEDSGGASTIYFTVNDGQGNFNMMGGVNHDGNRIQSDDGLSKILYSFHGQDGALSLNAGEIGTAGTSAVYNVGISVESSTQTLRIGNPNDNIGLTSTGGNPIADVAGNLYSTEYIYHNGDTDTNIRLTLDAIQLTAGNVEMIRLIENGTQDIIVVNENSNDVDFRVEGNSNTHLLFVDAGVDRIGIDTSDPQARFHINNDQAWSAQDLGSSSSGSVAFKINGRQSATHDFIISSNGTTDYTMQVVQDADNAGQLHINPFGGDVGVGTSSPSTKLHVVGDITLEDAGTPIFKIYDSGNAGGGGAAGIIQFANTSGNALGIGYTGDNTATSDLLISTNAGSTYGGYLGLDAGAASDPSSIILDAKTDVILAPENGNVGIGTTAPTANLHVVGSNNFATDKPTMISEAVVSMKPVTGSSGNLNFASLNGGAGIGLQYTNYAGTADWDIALQPFGGNVGIGVTDPDAALTVDGDIHLFDETGDPFIKLSVGNTIASPTKSYVVRVDNSDGDKFQIRDVTKSATRISLDTNGNVGIGTDSVSNAKLRVEGGGVDVESITDSLRLRFYSGSQFQSGIQAVLNTGEMITNSDVKDLAIRANGGNMLFAAGGSTERMRIEADGDVGIGVTNPSARLHVYSPTQNVASYFESGDQEVWISLKDSYSGTYGVLLGHSENDNQLFKIADGNANERLIMTTGGNVSIGDDFQPDARLHVSGTNNVLLVEGSGSTLVDVQGSEGQLFTVTDSLVGSLFSVNDISGLPILEVFDNDKVVAGTYGQNTLVVTGSSVGIGTDAPTVKLHVNGGSIKAEGNATDQYFLEGVRTGVGTTIRIYDNANTAYIDSYNNMAFRANQNGGSGGHFRFTGGNVGIGTITPGAKLHVDGNMFVEEGFRFGTTSNANLVENGYTGNLGLIQMPTLLLDQGYGTSTGDGRAYGVVAPGIFKPSSKTLADSGYSGVAQGSAVAGNFPNVKGEADVPIIDANAEWTYAEAVEALETVGARLPTLEELLSGVGAGSGQSYDDKYLWTQTSAGHGKVWVSRGHGATYNDAIIVSVTGSFRTRAFWDIDKANLPVHYDDNSDIRTKVVRAEHTDGLSLFNEDGSGIVINDNDSITFNNAFTFPTSDGSSGQALVTNGSGTVTWGTVSGGTPSQVETVATNTNANHYLTFVNSNNGTAAAETIYTTDGIYVNPSTDTFYATGNIISYASSDRRLKDNLTPIGIQSC